MRPAPPDPPEDPRPTSGPHDPRVPGDVSTEPGDGALSRVDAVKDEHLRRWDVATPAATLIGRPESPDADVSERVRQLHAEAHPAMAGHSERMHRLEKLRITHAFANTLDLTPWERDRALGIVRDLDLTAFGSQRGIEKVALVVLAHVVDEVRQHRQGLHDQEWLNTLSPSAMGMLYDRHESLTEDERFQDLLAEHDLDTTAVNRLKRTLRDQVAEQDLEGAAFGRNPHRDPALPAFTGRSDGESEENGDGWVRGDSGKSEDGGSD